MTAKKTFVRRAVLLAAFAAIPAGATAQTPSPALLVVHQGEIPVPGEKSPHEPDRPRQEPDEPEGPVAVDR